MSTWEISLTIENTNIIYCTFYVEAANIKDAIIDAYKFIEKHQLEGRICDISELSGG